MHVTPQFNHLGKMSTVLRVSTHLYGVFEEIDGKTFIFSVNLVSSFNVMADLYIYTKRPIVKQISFTPTCSAMTDLYI